MIYVPGSGPMDAKIIFIGEAPGENEEKQRAPFVGRSGIRLREDLAKVGIDADKVRINNVCHYRPPFNDIDKWIKHSRAKNKPPVQPNSLVMSGIIELFRELAEVKKNGGCYVIVPLGNTALWTLTGNQTISRRRGSMYTLQPNLNLLVQLNDDQLAIVADALTILQGTKVIPTFHPAFIEREMIMQPIFKLDLKRIATESKSRELILPERSILIDPDERTAVAFAERLLSNSEYSCDIETPSGKLFCVGYALNPIEAMVLGTDTTWKMELHRILLTSSNGKIFQNGTYDCTYLRREHQIIVQGYGYDYRTRTVLGHDTMFAQHAIYPEWRLGLDFLASVFTREPYYKDEGKNHDLSSFGDVSTYMRYCGKDACVTKEVADVQRRVEFRDQHFKHHFEYIMSQVALVIDIQSQGILLDIDELARLQQESQAASRAMQPNFDGSVLAELCYVAEHGKLHTQRQAAIELAEKIANAMGREKSETMIGGFNVYSAVDVQKYLYDVRGFKRVFKRNKKSETGESQTADEETIKELYGQSGDQKLLDLITLRGERKLQTSYLNVKHRPDGRTFFSINPVGARSSRWSESKTLDGYGFNFQTPPHKIRSMVIPDPGLVLFYIDLSQAEDRVVSYYAQVLRKIEAFEAGVDVHALTASLIFGISIEEVKARHKARKAKDGKDGPERYLGKQSNHAYNYGEGAPTFTKKINKEADETGIRIDLKTAKMIREGHLTAYPEIRWYWQDIEAQLKLNRTLIAPRIAGEKISWKRRFAGRFDADTFREAYSWIPQYIPPSICNRAAVGMFYEVLPHAGDSRTRILNQVHDALLGQCLPDEAESIVAECVKRMEVPIEIHSKDVIIPADSKIGPNWRELG